MTLSEERPPGEPVPTHVRYPSTIGGAFYLLVLTATVVGLGIVLLADDWRLGVRVVAGALAAAALIRLALPRKDAGMLAVRSRMVDVVLLAAVSGVLFILAGNIPEQPLP